MDNGTGFGLNYSPSVAEQPDFTIGKKESAACFWVAAKAFYGTSMQ
jgi:hypothetical protein